MSSITSLGNASQLNALAGAYRTNGSSPKPAISASRGSDSVELTSDVSRYLNVLKSSDVRTDKVASARAAIEAGKYEDDHKLNVAIDRLLEDIG